MLPETEALLQFALVLQVAWLMIQSRKLANEYPNLTEMIEDRSQSVTERANEICGLLDEIVEEIANPNGEVEAPTRGFSPLDLIQTLIQRSADTNEHGSKTNPNPVGEIHEINPTPNEPLQESS